MCVKAYARGYFRVPRKWKCLCNTMWLFRMRNTWIERNGLPLRALYHHTRSRKNQFVLLQIDPHVFLLWNSACRRRKIYTTERIIGRLCHTNWDPVRDCTFEPILMNGANKSAGSLRRFINILFISNLFVHISQIFIFLLDISLSEK